MVLQYNLARSYVGAVCMCVLGFRIQKFNAWCHNSHADFLTYIYFASELILLW